MSYDGPLTEQEKVLIDLRGYILSPAVLSARGCSRRRNCLRTCWHVRHVSGRCRLAAAGAGYLPSTQPIRAPNKGDLIGIIAGAAQPLATKSS
mgnify:CR=1 FL=1